MNKKLRDYVKNRFVAIASDLIRNPQGLQFSLKKASQKAGNQSVKEAFGAYLADLLTLIRMAKAWLSKSYQDVSTQTIIYAIVAIVYFLTPTDFLPDFMLGLGFIDDIAVLRWVVKLIKKDLDKFKAWEQEKNKESNEGDL